MPGADTDDYKAFDAGCGAGGQYLRAVSGKVGEVEVRVGVDIMHGHSFDLKAAAGKGGSVASLNSVMLAGGAEVNVRPALGGQVEVDPGWRQIGQVTAAVDGQVFHGLVLELIQLLRIGRADPAR